MKRGLGLAVQETSYGTEFCYWSGCISESKSLWDSVKVGKRQVGSKPWKESRQQCQRQIPIFQVADNEDGDEMPTKLSRVGTHPTRARRSCPLGWSVMSFQSGITEVSFVTILCIVYGVVILLCAAWTGKELFANGE
jgi:hypothetical protein